MKVIFSWKIQILTRTSVNNRINSYVPSGIHEASYFILLNPLGSKMEQIDDKKSNLQVILLFIIFFLSPDFLWTVNGHIYEEYMQVVYVCTLMRIIISSLLWASIFVYQTTFPLAMFPSYKILLKFLFINH